jgi:hypothetical protein
MRYVLFICNDPTGEPYDAEHDNPGKWVEALQSDGRYVLGDRLRPAEDATTVRVRAGERIVTDGPFTESREWIAGFDIIEADDLDAAIAVAAEHPMARFGSVEVRPVWPM